MLFIQPPLRIKMILNVYNKCQCKAMAVQCTLKCLWAFQYCSLSKLNCGCFNVFIMQSMVSWGRTRVSGWSRALCLIKCIFISQLIDPLYQSLASAELLMNISKRVGTSSNLKSLMTLNPLNFLYFFWGVGVGLFRPGMW